MEHPTKIAICTPVHSRLLPETYMFVFGMTGVRKTRLCENIIKKDINKRYSVVYSTADFHEDFPTWRAARGVSTN